MSESVRDILREYVESNYLPHANREILSDDQDLFDSGILDSASALDLLLFIEERFDITVPDEDFLPENFASLAAAAHYIGQRQNVVAAGVTAIDVGDPVG